MELQAFGGQVGSGQEVALQWEGVWMKHNSTRQQGYQLGQFDTISMLPSGASM